MDGGVCGTVNTREVEELKEARKMAGHGALETQTAEMERSVKREERLLTGIWTS